MRSCDIELGNLVEVIEYGEAIKTFEFRLLSAQKKSIRSSEFYGAANVGLKPELTFEVYLFEFKDDEKLKYNNKIYTIIRTYWDEKKPDKIDLIVSSKVGA